MNTMDTHAPRAPAALTQNEPPAAARPHAHRAPTTCYPARPVDVWNEGQTGCPPTSGERSQGADSRGKHQQGKRRYDDHLVKGFVRMECPHCGAVKTVFLKAPTTTYSCRVCGQDTDIDKEQLRRMYIKCPSCEVGMKFRTNLTSEQVTIDCRNCGAPVDLELGKSGNVYVMMK